MVVFWGELWFNIGMLKIQAINLLGGNMPDAASAMGISYQAVSKWPEVLPDRISDRVLGVCVRRGFALPEEFRNQGSSIGLQSSDIATAEPGGEWDGITERRKLNAPIDRRVSPESVARADFLRRQADIASAGQGV